MSKRSRKSSVNMNFKVSSCVLTVMKGYLCYHFLKVFRELNERGEQA